MSDDSSLALLLLGPAGGTGLYWLLYRYYRNTDKSHAFERETKIDAKPVTGTDAQIGEVTGVKNSRIPGDNVRDYRERVERMPGPPPKDGPPPSRTPLPPGS
jgi:hypothetical protein